MSDPEGNWVGETGAARQLPMFQVGSVESTLEGHPNSFNMSSPKTKPSKKANSYSEEKAAQARTAASRAGGHRVAQTRPRSRVTRSSWTELAPATGGDGFHAIHAGPADAPLCHQEANISRPQIEGLRHFW